LTDQEMNSESYVWKCLVVIFGIYIFFNIERILKMITEAKEVSSANHTLTLWCCYLSQIIGYWSHSILPNLVKYRLKYLVYMDT